MKICIAQTKSLKGKIHRNIQNHLRLIEYAIELEASLIMFPELSITSYEPKMGKELAVNIMDSIFNPFQTMSDDNDLVIGIGMPVRTDDGINIGMFVFQPHIKRMVYSKQILHPDEQPYFVGGKEHTTLNVKGNSIAVGICYETLQRQHFLQANEMGADIYIASVAKSMDGIDKAYLYFSKISNEFATPVLMSNCVGHCDHFLSIGQSAVWNKKGELIKKLDEENQGVLIYDTKSEKVESHQIIYKKRE